MLENEDNNNTNINTVKNSRENTETSINDVSNTEFKIDNKQEINNAISSIETDQQEIDAEILDFENKIQTKYKKLFG